jgi:hydroxymethylglutaryl-CoA reductase
MGLHAHRVAYMAGARDDQLEHVVAHMRAAGDYSLGAAKRLLDEIASSREQK